MCRYFKIKTSRQYCNEVYWHIVHEWEDDFAQFISTCSIELITSWGNKKDFTHRAVRKLRKSIRKITDKYLYSFSFEMTPYDYNYYSINPRKNISCIIDFWLTKEDLPSFYKCYSERPVILITSAEVIEFLKQSHCPISAIHFPVSISDRYAINPYTRFLKAYDLVLFGRQNVVLNNFLDRYVLSHQNFVYVDRKIEGSKFIYFTNKGKIIGEFGKREDYLNLMKMTKIALYSTSSIDGSRPDTNGYNPVTPRFLEYIACGCHVISRYPKNADTDFYELPLLGPSIETYEMFESAMDNALTTEPDMTFYSEYLKKHYTSVRAKQLKEIIKSIN